MLASIRGVTVNHSVRFVYISEHINTRPTMLHSAQQRSKAIFVTKTTRSQAVARIADRTAKNCRGHSRDLGHAHFRGIFVRPLGIHHRKLHTKFEVSSSSSFRDIAL